MYLYLYFLWAPISGLVVLRGDSEKSRSIQEAAEGTTSVVYFRNSAPFIMVMKFASKADNIMETMATAQLWQKRQEHEL